MAHPPQTSGIRHWLGFLVSGGTAFAIDAGVLTLLIWFTPMPVLVCRLCSIMAAMVIGWQMHRRLAFGLRSAGTLREFLRLASVAWTSSAINYGTFVLLLFLLPGKQIYVSMFLSSGLAMIMSYLGYQLYVFRSDKEP